MPLLLYLRRCERESSRNQIPNAADGQPELNPADPTPTLERSAPYGQCSPPQVSYAHAVAFYREHLDFLSRDDHDAIMFRTVQRVWQFEAWGRGYPYPLPHVRENK